MYRFQNSLIQPRIRNLITTPRPHLFKVLREVARWRTDKEYSWEELSEILNYTVERLQKLNSHLSKSKAIPNRSSIRYPGKALAVSYTEEGLKFACSTKGEMLYFKDAMFVGPNMKIVAKTDKLVRNPNTLVEDFIPRDHIFNFKGKPKLNYSWQNTEIMWTDKALRMLYVSSSYGAYGAAA